MKKRIEITTCQECPFLNRGQQTIECKHPYFENKKTFSDLIIPSKESNFPEECPLRRESLEMVYKLSEKSIDADNKRKDEESYITIPHESGVVK